MSEVFQIFLSRLFWRCFEIKTINENEKVFIAIVRQTYAFCERGK